MNKKTIFDIPGNGDKDSLIEMENSRVHPINEINYLKKPETEISEKITSQKEALLNNKSNKKAKIIDRNASIKCYIYSRLGFKFVILFLMASTLLAVLFYFSRISAVEGSGEFVPKEKKFALNIETSFCKVLIKEHNSSSIKYDYKLNYLLDFKNSTAPNITNSGNKASILLKSSKKLWRTCVFTFMIPSDLTLTEFNVNCTSECIIISVHPRISIDRGEWVSSQRLDMNWRNLYVKEALKFNSPIGTLQLNEFRVEGIASIKLNIGDVILQSTSDIKLNWTNPSLAYCFAGPVVKEEISQQCSSDLRVKGTAIINNGNNTSTKTNTTSNASNTTGICSGVTTICKTETCKSPSAVTVSQISGNTYVNLLPETGVDVSYNPSLQIAQGYPNNDSVSLEDSLEKEILKIYNISIKERDPILIVNVGPKHLQQQSYQKWVVSSNPSFSYLRPWWLAVFSLNLLTAKTLDFTGTFAPGSCPYHFSPTIGDLAKVQNSLMSFLNLSRAEYSFVQPMNTQWPGENPINGTGISEFYNGKPVSEDWIKVEKNAENQFVLKPINILTHDFVLPTLILSFTGAAMMGLFITRLFMVAVVTLNKKITNMANHTQNYKKYNIDLLRATEEEKNNEWQNEVGNEEEDVRINIGEILRESSFVEFMKTVPRMSVFVSFASYSWLKKYLLNSVRAFCDAIFREEKKENFDEIMKKTSETEILQMKEIRLKFNYEKFCFLNHYSEKSLLENERIFLVYGYCFIPDKEALAFPFLVEKKTAQLPEAKELQEKTDEEAFDAIFNSIYEKSELESDTILMDEIKNNYDFYCNKYRFPKNSDLSDEEFAVRNNLKKIYKSGLKLVANETIKRPRPVIWVLIVLRILDFIWWPIEKIFKYRSPFKPTCEKFYVLDEKGLREQFNFVSMTNPEEKKHPLVIYAVKKTLFYRFFYLHEILFLVSHFIITLLFVAPFLLMALLYEISYEPYSTVSQDELISLKDSLWTTLELPFRIPAFIEWNQAIIGLIILFSIVNVIDDLLYFFNMEFPEDRKFLGFQKQKDDSHNSCMPNDCPRFMNTTWGLRHLNIFLLKRHTIIRRLLINIYWCFVLFLIFCYCSYIGLVMLWLLLGAIINPNNFLVYATSSLTFLTFVSVKYNQFTSLTADGMKGIMEIVERLLKEKMKAISGVLSQELGKAIARVKSISQVAAMTNFAESQAKDFGLDKEFAEMKSLIENPEKILGQIFSNTELALVNPEELKSKFERKKEEWYNLAKNAFRTKCRTYKIDDKVIDLLIELNLKIDRNQLVITFSNFLQNSFQYRRLELDWSEEMVQSIISLVCPHKTLKNREETYSHLVKNIVGNVLTAFKIIPWGNEKLVSFIFNQQGGDDKVEIILDMVLITIPLLQLNYSPMIVKLKTNVLPLLNQSQSNQNPNKEKIVPVKTFIKMISEMEKDQRARDFIGLFLLFDKTQGGSDLLGGKINHLQELKEFFKTLFSIKDKEATKVAFVCQLLKGCPDSEEIHRLHSFFEDEQSIPKDFSYLFNLLIGLWGAKFNLEGIAKLAEKRISYEYFLDIVCLLTKNLWRNYTNDRIIYLERAETTAVIAKKIIFNSPDQLVNLLKIFWTSDLDRKEELVKKFYHNLIEKDRPPSQLPGFKRLYHEYCEEEEILFFKKYNKNPQDPQGEFYEKTVKPFTERENSYPFVSFFEANGSKDYETLKKLEKNIEVFSLHYNLNKDYLHKLILLLNGIEKEESLEFILRNTAIMKNRELVRELMKLIISQKEESISESYTDMCLSYFIKDKYDWDGDKIEEWIKNQDIKDIVKIMHGNEFSDKDKCIKTALRLLLRKLGQNEHENIQLLIKKLETKNLNFDNVLEYLEEKKDGTYFLERFISFFKNKLKEKFDENTDNYKKLLFMATILNWDKDTEYLRSSGKSSQSSRLFETILSDLKIKEFQFEVVWELKHYFSGERKSFIRTFLNSESEVLEAILSFLDRDPDYKLILQYLKISRYQVESVISFLDFWKMRKGDPQAVEILRKLEESATTAHWCDKLGIVKAELFALLRIHYNLLTNQDIDELIANLNIGDLVNVSTFKNLISLFSKIFLPEIHRKDEKREISIFRKKFFLLKDLGISNPENFLYDLELKAGNFHNLQTLYLYCQGPQEKIQSNRILKMYFYVLGCMICDNFEDFHPHKILKEFIGLNPLELRTNSFKSIAYWLFKNFNIHPLFLVYILNNHPQTISYVNRIFKDRGLLEKFKEDIAKINKSEIEKKEFECEEFSIYCITMFEEQRCQEYIKDKRPLWFDGMVKENNLMVINAIIKAREECRQQVVGEKLKNIIEKLISIKGTRKKDFIEFDYFKSFLSNKGKNVSNPLSYSMGNDSSPDEEEKALTNETSCPVPTKKASGEGEFLSGKSKEKDIFDHLIQLYKNKYGKGDSKISDLLQFFLKDSQNESRLISQTIAPFSGQMKSNKNKLDLLLSIINSTQFLYEKTKANAENLINLLTLLDLEPFLFGSIRPMLELNSEKYTKNFEFIDEAIFLGSFDKEKERKENKEINDSNDSQNKKKK